VVKPKDTPALKSEASSTNTNTQQAKEEVITIDPSLQAENNSNATATPPTQPKKEIQPLAVSQPNSLKVEVEKFGKNVEGIISDHVSRLPMSEKEAVEFIKKSNTKCRVEVLDVEVVLDEATGKKETQQIITVFLGNEKYEFKPLKLQ